jgi:hypothetical protein
MVLFVSKVTLLLKVVPQFLYRAGGERHLAVCRGHVRCPVGTAPSGALTYTVKHAVPVGANSISRSHSGKGPEKYSNSLLRIDRSR